MELSRQPWLYFSLRSKPTFSKKPQPEIGLFEVRHGESPTTFLMPLNRGISAQLIVSVIESLAHELLMLVSTILLVTRVSPCLMRPTRLNTDSAEGSQSHWHKTPLCDLLTTSWKIMFQPTLSNCSMLFSVAYVTSCLLGMTIQVYQRQSLLSMTVKIDFVMMAPHENDYICWRNRVKIVATKS